ncbi:HNH endonuclease [Leptolyngbya sp. NIES-2104]|uniref:HNH endonuclease n=1 Tax=Leptolyngbya sp. NIES-2104 TaxID=1552121 RepID=UPI0006EC8212|nr:HNH endonuclease [Leptolyngbya sp. NIES-2104]GAP96573.1 HNH endonuclease family protein [Leptolyngbya sp. NIES-2104]
MQATEPHILQASIVVFSRNYLPIGRINIKRAIVLILTGQAEAIDFDDARQWEVRSPNVVLQVSEHIRLTGANPERHWKTPAVSRREILRRDNHTCQYCGSTKHLTIDHVIPRSKGGTHTWDNVVTACATCNSKKSDRFLSELGMKLKAKPKPPIHPAIAFAEQFWQASEKKL